MRRRSSVVRKVTALGAGAALFFTGVAYGNGTIDFSLRPAAQQATTNNLPSQLDYSSLDSVYRSLKENFDGKLTEEQIIDGLKHGLAASAKDPYTVYFNAKEAKEFNEQLNNSFAGIGARLSKDSDDNLIVGEAIAGFPAEKAGIKARDIIIEVDGQPTASLTLDDAIAKIRGPEGTEVKIKVVRNRSETLDITVQRAIISLPSVTSKTLDGNIGYIQIGSFSNDTYDLTQKAAQDFKNANVKGIILDMRNNPGGLLEQSINVSSLWLPSGTKVLEERRGSTVTKSFSSRGGDILRGIPTIVLINEGSASASEIVAGALRDNNAARIIGSKSYGKGVVQQLINLKDGGQLKVTVASWYRPNGQNINEKGITPDDLVKLTDENAKANKDTQLEAAQNYLRR